MVISVGIWNEYGGIKFYDGDKVTKETILHRDSIVITNYLQEIAKKNGYSKAYLNNVQGIAFDDDVKIRNARTLKFEKNDVFSLKEYDECTRENKKILYIPTKLEAQGTIKRMESNKGYWLYEKTLVNHPIIIGARLCKKITEEEAKALCKEWGGTENGAKYVKLLDDGMYILREFIDVALPSFSLLTYKETIKSNYGKQLESMVKTIREKAGVHIDQYSLEKILEIYDITEKKQEG